MLPRSRRGAAGARRGAIEHTRDGWHSDLSYDPVPAKATLLHALDVPSRGGHTCFSNAAAAYAALPGVPAPVEVSLRTPVIRTDSPLRARRPGHHLLVRTAVPRLGGRPPARRKLSGSVSATAALPYGVTVSTFTPGARISPLLT